MRNQSIKSRDYLAITLRTLRERIGVSQSELARTMGVNPSVVSRYEFGANPTLSTLDSFVSALGGELILLAAFPRADGTITRHLIRTCDDPRDRVNAKLLEPRHRKPRTVRPSAEARQDRLEAIRNKKFEEFA